MGAVRREGQTNQAGIIISIIISQRTDTLLQTAHRTTAYTVLVPSTATAGLESKR